MAEIIDLDVFDPPARMVKFTDLAGKVHSFDVSFISFKTSMFMLAHLDEFRGLQKLRPEDVNEDTYRVVLGVIEKIAVQSDRELTIDFLLENLSMTKGFKILQAAMETIAGFLASNPQVAERTEAGE